MGFIYKLRQDIVDFIVQKKKDHPEISCRDLVGVVRDTFGVDVSKSSVNAVVKQFQLSGPVGRHSVHKAPKNYSIPKDKKDILLKNVQSYLPVVGPAESVVLAPDLSVKSLPLVEIAVIRSDEDANNSRDEAITLLPDPITVQPSREQVQGEIKHQIEAQTRQVAGEQSRAGAWLGDAGKVYGRLGASVLWFAFKTACSSHSLGEILARELAPLPEGVMPGQCEVLFFTTLFSEHRPGFESDDLTTLWRLAGLDDRSGRALFDKAVFLERKQSLIRTIAVELAMAFTPVRYVRLSTRGGDSCFLDLAQQRLYGDLEFAASAAAGLPVFAAVERTVDRMITSRFPLIADVSGPKLFDVVRLMEGVGDDAFQAVALTGGQGLTSAEFLLPGSMIRGFIFRVCLTVEDLARVEYDIIDNKKTFVDVISARKCGYYEGVLMLEPGHRPLRVIQVKPDGWGESFVLLSNISAYSLPVNRLLAKFFRSETGIFMGNVGDKVVTDECLAPQAASIRDTFRVIDMYTRKFFLPSSSEALSWEDMCEQLYDLPGHIQEHSDTLLFCLEQPIDFLYRKELASFLQFLNRALFKSADGRQVIFQS